MASLFSSAESNVSILLLLAVPRILTQACGALLTLAAAATSSDRQSCTRSLRRRRVFERFLCLSVFLCVGMFGALLLTGYDDG
jgi:uncharacterized membrane protein (DUF4010 family)